MPGHGFSRISRPRSPAGTGSPLSLTTFGATPGSGKLAEPGFSGGISMAGACEMRMPPVSVCHQVSTIGQRPLPMWS